MIEVNFMKVQCVTVKLLIKKKHYHKNMANKLF